MQPNACKQWDEMTDIIQIKAHYQQRRLNLLEDRSTALLFKSISSFSYTLLRQTVHVQSLRQYISYRTIIPRSDRNFRGKNGLADQFSWNFGPLDQNFHDRPVMINLPPPPQNLFPPIQIFRNMWTPSELIFQKCIEIFGPPLKYKDPPSNCTIS